MDDIFQDIHKDKKEDKLQQNNSLHPNFSFTNEYQNPIDKSLAYLDMRMFNNDGHLSSTWYTKPTDTGLVMNFYALAPKKYKKSVVAGFVHRIYRACSSWSYFHQSLEKAKKILRENQYPEQFYEPIISAALTKLVTQNCTNESSESEDTSILSQSFHDSQDDVNRCHHNIDDKDKFM